MMAFLNAGDLIRLQLVCKIFDSLSQDNTLWQSVTDQKKGDFLNSFWVYKTMSFYTYISFYPRYLSGYNNLRNILINEPLKWQANFDVITDVKNLVSTDFQQVQQRMNDYYNSPRRMKTEIFVLIKYKQFNDSIYITEYFHPTTDFIKLDQPIVRDINEIEYLPTAKAEKNNFSRSPHIVFKSTNPHPRVKVMDNKPKLSCTIS
jgi:hypothetical protein